LFAIGSDDVELDCLIDHESILGSQWSMATSLTVTPGDADRGHSADGDKHIVRFKGLPCLLGLDTSTDLPNILMASFAAFRLEILVKLSVFHVMSPDSQRVWRG
jgi:hypothetical protein